MDDMTAFESQVAREAMREAGPSRSVEVESIVRAATTTSPPGSWHVVTRRRRSSTTAAPKEGGFTMFSAVKFIAAGVIVALFGGFLLSGVLTAPQNDKMAPAAAITPSPSPGPLGVGGRVEVPAAGFALTLPDSWTYIRQSQSDLGTLLDLIAAEAPEHRDGFWDVAQVTIGDDPILELVAASPPEPDVPLEQGCYVAVDEAVEGYPRERLVAEELAPAPEDLVELYGEVTQTRTDVSLPAGEAVRIDRSVEDVEISIYLLTAGSRQYRLECTAEVHPEDRWLSIAETLEFLPPALSGMVTEEVEPGVFRVDNDGVRDLSNPDEGFPGYFVDVTPDGSVWLTGEGVGQPFLFRLGGGPTIDDPTVWPPFRQVAPDGSLWAISEDAIRRSFDGEAWTERASSIGDGLSLEALAIGPDSTAWVVARDRDERCLDSSADCPFTVLIRLEGDGSTTTIDDWAGIYAGHVASDELAVSPDGDVWLIGMGRWDAPEAEALLRFDGTEWEVIPGPEGFINYHLGNSLAIGPDSTLWVHTNSNAGGLARFDEAGWTAFTEADGVRGWGGQGFISTDLLHIAADGSLWMNGSTDNGGCDGVAHFDGTTWTSYLRGSCVHDLDIAPDGGVWLRANTYRGMNPAQEVSLYVITPEAVAVAES